ncbi:MAG: phosphotransferase [Balneolaceae bacterium]|nr:MAG: phosphotransferase [Balneolaceae bacterium]
MHVSNHTADNYQKLHEFLKNRESYPHKPDFVQHVQTHISRVYIAPPYVYKFKKPVDFGFLDYSTLDKRKHFCEQEVELNRRLCSEIYIGVVAITKNEEGYEITPEPTDKAEIVEYAVKMKKLKEEYFLHSYIENNSLTKGHLDRVSDKLADFYLQQSPGNDVTRYGEIDKIRFNTDENFQQTEVFIGNTISREAFEGIKYFTDGYLDQREELFTRRVEENRIVDGHGDLHLEHIHVGPKKICIYDCIEFNERFRCGDQAVDLAFLAMDLDYHDRWGESRYFVDQMAQKLDDPDLTTIIDFYKCYRAYVKGKVKSLKSTDEEFEENEKQAAVDLASEYFHLSLRYALIGSRPLVLICMGRIGTGKSTLADHLSKTVTIDSFSSDRVRKKLAGLPLHERPEPEKRKELYSAEMSRKTYQTLLGHAKKNLEDGKPVIMDATFSLQSSRQNFIDELEAVDADFVFIEAQASDEVVKSRLKSRDEENDIVSDARLEDFEMLNSRYEPPNEIDRRHKIEIDTCKVLTDTIKDLYKKLVDRQLPESGVESSQIPFKGW